jgi:hypothetical protein
MFADLDRSDGTRDAPSLTRLVTQFLDKLSSVMTHAPPSLVCALWQVAAGRWHSWLAAALRRFPFAANSFLVCTAP